MFRGLIFRLGLLGVVVIGGMGFYYTDRALNYVEVQARIDDIRSQCSLERTRYYGVAKRREWTDDMNCDEAEALLRDRSAYAGMTLKRKIEVFVRYTSPPDSQIHTSSYKTTGSPGTLEKGGVVDIMANKTRPNVIENL
ncbi:hypothetical protein [uncultured Sphingomonas sp.]|uniref:hypothetical protein n=1 Tax=uncultured Sphingomonas sp. TaxID=158754 RepID=UPI0035CC03B6